jgi:hypothetical protein
MQLCSLSVKLNFAVENLNCWLENLCGKTRSRVIRTKGGEGEEGGNIRLAAERLCGVNTLKNS